MSYEYQSMVLSFDSEGQDESMQRLNAAGAEGWELAFLAPHFVRMFDGGWACDRGLAILKRRLPESVISAR